MNRTIRTLEENKRKTLLVNSKEAMMLMNSESSQSLGQQNQGGGGGGKKKKNKNKNKGGQTGMSKEQEDELI